MNIITSKSDAESPVGDQILELISAEDVTNAASKIGESISNTPCLYSKTLSDIAGCEIFIKFENLQFTASFKERGALNKLLTLSEAERHRGVIAMSAGNHAQGLAYHAHRLGIPATIVMPNGTPFTKILRTKSHGANVLVEGEALAEASAYAHLLAEQKNLTFVHPYDDPLVIAGQGTLAIEVLQVVPSPDVIVVPVGGGGLISGIAAYLSRAAPNCEVVGVQSQTYPSMARFVSGDVTPVVGGRTIAEGIAVQSPGHITGHYVKSLNLKMFTVDESAIENGVALLLDVEKTVAEGAGAAALAAVLENRHYFSGKRVIVPVTGGNIDLRVLSAVAMRALVRNGQLVRLTVGISDQPGALTKLTNIIANTGANVLDICHNRLALGLTAKCALIDVGVEVQNDTHGLELINALRHEGHDVKLLQ